jgi:hypothetical protein
MEAQTTKPECRRHAVSDDRRQVSREILPENSSRPLYTLNECGGAFCFSGRKANDEAHYLLHVGQNQNCNDHS